MLPFFPNLFRSQILLHLFISYNISTLCHLQPQREPTTNHLIMPQNRDFSVFYYQNWGFVSCPIYSLFHNRTTQHPGCTLGSPPPPERQTARKKILLEMQINPKFPPQKWAKNSKFSKNFEAVNSFNNF